MIKTMFASKETRDHDVLYVTDVKVCTDLKTFLENLGDEIATASQIFKDGKTLNRQIFTRVDKRVRQRIGLYLERQIKRKVLHFVENAQLQYAATKLGTIHLSDSIYTDILREVQEEHPDSCELYELEACLERMKSVSAFGIDENEITVYVNKQNEFAKVKADLEAHMPEIKTFNMSIKIWCQNTEIERYHLKQGSKITTSADHLRDSEQYLYFTTCGHVIPHEHHAYDENKICLGRSIFEIDPSVERENRDRLDLSIVKVGEEIAPRCKLGLRNLSDHLVSGKITDKHVIMSEVGKGLKVYKWGAKSGLTRGKYKGVIAKKNDDDVFDQTLHKIMCESGTFAEEGDSGSLVCFEATGSPQFQRESAAYIFVGKLIDKEEISIVDKEHFYMCYHISNVFDCKVHNEKTFKPCFQPTNVETGNLASGTEIQALT